jgi:hypothetical protein
LNYAIRFIQIRDIWREPPQIRKRNAKQDEIGQRVFLAFLDAGTNRSVAAANPLGPSCAKRGIAQGGKIRRQQAGLKHLLDVGVFQKTASGVPRQSTLGG